jgi:RNA polymerase sigma-70 factor (ECF subfamily)
MFESITVIKTKGGRRVMKEQTYVDSILIERSQLGDPYAIDELLNKYHNTAFMYALKMTKHVEEAADVVSEGFIRVHRAIGRFQANSSFSTWMFKILRNCFLDIRKKRRVKVVASLDAAMESEDGVVFMQPIDESESAYESSAKSEFSEQVRQALDRLPAHQKDLLLLYHEDELTYEEIAERMQTPAGTIKSRLHRARLNLQQIIKDDPQLMPLAMGS